MSSSPQIAYELLKTPKVRDAIAARQVQISKRLGITADRIFQELALIAFAKLDDQVDDAGVLNKGAPTEVVVSTVNGKDSVTKTTTVKTVRMADKIAALEKLGKGIGAFKEQVEVSGKLNLLELINESFDPAPKPTPIRIVDMPANVTLSSPEAQTAF